MAYHPAGPQAYFGIPDLYQEERVVPDVPRRVDYSALDRQEYRSYISHAPKNSVSCLGIGLNTGQGITSEANCTKEQFQLVWAFLMFVPILDDGSALGKPYIKLDENGGTGYNFLEREDRLSAMNGWWIGEIISVLLYGVCGWGEAAPLRVDAIVREQRRLHRVSHSTNHPPEVMKKAQDRLWKTLCYLREIDEKAPYFIQKIRAAYHTWWDQKARARHETFWGVHVEPNIAIVSWEGYLEGDVTHYHGLGSRCRCMFRQAHGEH